MFVKLGGILQKGYPVKSLRSQNLLFNLGVISRFPRPPPHPQSSPAFFASQTLRFNNTFFQCRCLFTRANVFPIRVSSPPSLDSSAYNLQASNKSSQSKTDKKYPAKPMSPGMLSFSLPVPSQKNNPKLHFCIKSHHRKPLKPAPCQQLNTIQKE